MTNTLHNDTLKSDVPRVQSVLPNPKPIAQSTIADRIELQNRLQKVILFFVKKLEKMYGREFPKIKTLTYSGSKDGNINFRLGAHFIFSFPEEFIHATENIGFENVDILIEDWRFTINSSEISLAAWLDSDVIDGIIDEAKEKAMQAVKQSGSEPLDYETLEEIEKRLGRKVKTLRDRLRRSIASLDKKLLPPTVTGEERIGGKSGQKILAPELGKHPIFGVEKRKKP